MPRSQQPPTQGTGSFSRTSAGAAGRGGRRRSERDGHAASRRRISQASPARLAALRACRIVRERSAFAQEVIESTIDETYGRGRLLAEDRAFATLLVLGVTAMWGTLDEVIDACLRSPDDIQPDVRDALRISTYELLFLHKEPYAVVDQGVELVRSCAPRAAGVGNAVLRKMTRLAPSFPFGDPRSDLRAAARLQGFPFWLARLLVDDLGKEAAYTFMQASNEPAPLYIAENPFKAQPGEVAALLEDVKARFAAVSHEGRALKGCWRVRPAHVLSDGRMRYALDSGKMLVSDASSQMVAALVLPDRKPASLLEIGSGRGTKTILLEAEAQRRWGGPIKRHVALDNHPFKAKLLKERVRNFGITTVETCVADATRLSRALKNQTFECVFVDAPCSGLGTLRRHAEIRWRLTPNYLDELAQVQLSLLRNAAAHVVCGGRLVYATCTVTRKENLEVVKGFLASPEGAAFKLVPVNGQACFAPQLVPDGPDAHFAVALQRR